ncbi:retrovirus-related pol polyprotein from transposon TNT 1-94, partial [Tanacetum coccineum]
MWVEAKRLGLARMMTCVRRPRTGGDDAVASGDISILNSLIGHGSPRSLQLCETIGTTDVQVLIDKVVDKEVQYDVYTLHVLIPRSRGRRRSRACRKTTPLVHSYQRDPEAPALSLINQDLLYLKKGNSGPEKIVLSLHKFPAVIFNDDDIEERTSRWVNKCVRKFNPYARYGVEHWKNPHAKIFYIRKQKEPGKPKEEVYSNSKIVQGIKTYWELGHEHKFITEIVARRANKYLVSITEPDYKNLNKNDIEDIYLLIMNGKVPDYADTGLLWSLSVFIRSTVIWERVHDFQLGIESYQQKVNLTAPTMTFPGIEDHEMFSIIYEPVHGIIYKNSKKEKRVMRHSEIHKFCDATLNRVLEGLKSYNNDIKYGYVQKDLTKDEAEYLKLFEEEIEERLKHQDLEGDDLLLHDAEMEVMNMILLSIPNEIYNSVDACTSAKDMWKRVERLMRGTIQNKVDRETCFTNKFDQFVSEPGETLVSVYNRFAQLMNDLERNNMNFPTVTINTKFLNSLQPEWLKYVTQVRLAKQLTVDSFDDLFDYLQQFEKLVNASRAKKLEKSHDPLALVAHTGSSSRQTSSYYVTHPMSVVNYDDEYQQDDVHNNSKDPLVSAMFLLAKAITQNFSNPKNNRLRASSNTRNQAIIQGDRVNIQSRNSSNTGRNSRRAYVQEDVVEGMNSPKETKNVQRTLRTPSSGNTSTVQCYNCSEIGHYARNCPKPRVRDSKYFMEQMLLVKQD